MNFGRIHQISFFSFLSSSFLLQLDQGGNLAGYSLSPSLIFPLSYPLGHKGWGEPEANLAKIALHPSLSLRPPSTPNQRRATAQMHPRTLPASACSTLASRPLPRSPRPPHAHSCRPRCRGQASPCHHTTSSPQPPSTMPNSLLPPTPSIGRLQPML
jgi:hypothetical protein